MHAVAALALAAILVGCESAPTVRPDATLVGRAYAVICNTSSVADCATRVDDLVAAMARRFPNRRISWITLLVGSGWSVQFADGEAISAEP